MKRKAAANLQAAAVIVLDTGSGRFLPLEITPTGRWDFSEGVFDFSAAAVEQEGEDRFTMALDGGSYDQMVRDHVNALLAGEYGSHAGSVISA